MGPSKLYGKIIGTEPAWWAGREYDKAFDGRIDTYVDSLFKSGWTGIELDESELLVKFRYYPRKNWTSRLVGAKIQASNDGANWVTLHTITLIW